MTGIAASVDIDLTALRHYEKAIDAGLNQAADNAVAKALKQWGARYRSWAQQRYNKYSRGGGDWKPLADSTKMQRRSTVKSKHYKSKRKSPGGTKIEYTASSKKSMGGKRGAKTNKLKRTLSGLQKSRIKLKGKGVFAKVKSGIAQSSKRKKRIAKAKKALAKHRAGNLRNKILKVRFSILRDLGLLFNVLAPVFQGTPGAIQQRIPYGIRVGYGGASRHGKGRATIADIADIHNRGLGNMPKRVIIAPPPENVLTMMAKDMDRALKQLSETVQ